MNFWVIKNHRGNYSTVGPFKSEEACHNRYLKTHGGEVHEFRSQSTIASEVISEFKSEVARGAV